MKYSIPYQNLDLYHTLSSGQTFEWFHDKKNDEWSGVIYSNPIKIKQIGDKKEGNLEYESEKEILKDIKNYFSLDLNYDELIERISFDPYIKIARKKLDGLRIIRQDPWFCINSFILSSNNTVKNIQSILKNISIHIYGNNSYSYYKFPLFNEVKDLSESDFRNFKAGFRSKFLVDFYNKLKEEPNFIENINKLNYEDAKVMLMSIKGIGEKVADCILLYAFNKYEAYPIDTHLRQATLECYFSDDTKYPKKPSDKELRQWAKVYWGDLAGLAHFYLFTYHRLYGKILM